MALYFRDALLFIALVFVCVCWQCICALYVILQQERRKKCCDVLDALDGVSSVNSECVRDQRTYIAHTHTCIFHFLCCFVFISIWLYDLRYWLFSSLYCYYYISLSHVIMSLSSVLSLNSLSLSDLTQTHSRYSRCLRLRLGHGFLV